MRVAILGFGSVGQGVARMIGEKNLGLTVTAVADSKGGIIDHEGISIPRLFSRKAKSGCCGNPGMSALDIVETDAYDVLVEVTPTNIATGEPALTHIRTALGLGRHVVTSNKGPIALARRELLDLAAKNGVALRYEATVCGAIPIIHTLEHGLLGNTVLALFGVMNGTCNYILTRMEDEGLTYDQALGEAQEMGYAEKDPTYDVKGLDTALKLVILANTVWGTDRVLADVQVTGIDLITPQAIQLAMDRETAIRLIGEAVPSKGLLRVSPRIIPRTHPLLVEGTLNAVTVVTDMAGELTFIGKGAGSIETASAVIGDLLYIRERYAGRP
ncbi:MAG TPA: homoserine dehydrogenase [Methanomicrobiales archaeon]|jgi:homoserine dehydrogenase|nr:homoserine dehydrogenase [Methanomicrobiales archaeon]